MLSDFACLELAAKVVLMDSDRGLVDSLDLKTSVRVGRSLALE